MGSKSKGNSNEDALKAQAEAARRERDEALRKATTELDPFEVKRRKTTMDTLNWEDGTSGPIDIRKFPGQAQIALYNEAKHTTDAGRVGKGLATLEGGGNADFSAALDKEMQMERDLNAAGMLEGNVNQTLALAHGAAGDLSAMGNARSLDVAHMLNSNYNSAQDRYMQYLMRPKQPGFLKSLVSGLVGNLSYAPSGGAFGLAGLAI